MRPHLHQEVFVQLISLLTDEDHARLAWFTPEEDSGQGTAQAVAEGYAARTGMTRRGALIAVIASRAASAASPY